MNKISIICSADKEFINLYDTFVDYTYKQHKIEDVCDLKLNILRDVSIVPKGFCTLSYFVYRQKHIEYLLDYLINNNDEYIISIDSDIIFLQGFKDLIQDIINDNSDTELFFSCDADDKSQIPNIGFMVLKNTQETRNFLSWLINYIGLQNNKPCNRFYTDLKNYLLSNNNFKTQIINNQYIIHNNAPSDIIKQRVSNSHAACFHATSTKNIYDKVLILSRIMHFMEGK